MVIVDNISIFVILIDKTNVQCAICSYPSANIIKIIQGK